MHAENSAYVGRSNPASMELSNVILFYFNLNALQNKMLNNSPDKCGNNGQVDPTVPMVSKIVHRTIWLY
jgi:hypothetical protein